MPGPGSYNPTWLEQTQASSFGSSKRNTFGKTIQAPGPGAYNPSLRPDGPQFSIKGKVYKDKLDNLPGPGQYNPDKNEKAPAYSLGSSNRNTLAHKQDQIPGPGNYNIKNLDGSPRWRFANGRAKERKMNTSPGPGSYNLKTTIGELPAYALSKR